MLQAYPQVTRIVTQGGTESGFAWMKAIGYKVDDMRGMLVYEVKK